MTFWGYLEKALLDQNFYTMLWGNFGGKIGQLFLFQHLVTLIVHKGEAFQNIFPGSSILLSSKLFLLRRRRCSFV